jgi:hypothetical protein
VQTTSATTTAAPPAKKHKRRKVAPLAVATPTGPTSFPRWGIAGLALAALLIAGGITGLLVTRGRR